MSNHKKSNCKANHTRHAVFEHNCTNCVFLTTTSHDEDNIDWYFCKENGSLGGSLLGRFGHEPWEYWSMPSKALIADHLGSRFHQEALLLRELFHLPGARNNHGA